MIRFTASFTVVTNADISSIVSASFVEDLDNWFNTPTKLSSFTTELNPSEFSCSIVGAVDVSSKTYACITLTTSANALTSKALFTSKESLASTKSFNKLVSSCVAFIVSRTFRAL